MLFSATLLGKQGIPILMFHRITLEASQAYEDRFDITADNLRLTLEELSKQGYVTVKLEDILLHKRRVKNKKAIILRFDDSTQDQFNYIQDKNGNIMIDPNCAVAILLEFYKKHPKFGNHAIFFTLAGREFGQSIYSRQKLEFLLENGMEIGNHGLIHEYLTNYTAQDIDRNFGQAMSYWYQLLGQKAGRIKIVATPFASRPQNISALDRLKAFSWNSKNFRPLGILYDKEKLLIRNQIDPYDLPSFAVTNNNFVTVLNRIKDLNR